MDREFARESIEHLQSLLIQARANEQPSDFLADFTADWKRRFVEAVHFRDAVLFGHEPPKRTRRGRPQSPDIVLYPALLYLKKQGLSFLDAWEAIHTFTHCPDDSQCMAEFAFEDAKTGRKCACLPSDLRCLTGELQSKYDPTWVEKQLNLARTPESKDHDEFVNAIVEQRRKPPKNANRRSKGLKIKQKTSINS